MSVINTKYLNLDNMKEVFFNASPFPHLMLDNFLDEKFFLNLSETFEKSIDSTQGKVFNTTVEEKKWISLNSTLPGVIKQIVDSLNSDSWVDNIRRLTGINSLVVTPNGNTDLANYHVMEPGGILGPHVDHSHEPIKGIPHVVNVILYLTENWDEGVGGATIFYDKKGKKEVKKVPYRQNRAVIFLHTPYSFHGVERINMNTTLKR